MFLVLKMCVNFDIAFVYMKIFNSCHRHVSDVHQSVLKNMFK